MTECNLIERFKRFSHLNTFSRVDAQHPLELYIGLDDKNRKTLELRASFTPHKLVGTTSIEVNQYKNSKYNTVRFSLSDTNVEGLFYKFIIDLVEHSRSILNIAEGYDFILNRFSQWKKMFISSKKNLLTEPEIMGLIGEILFLRDTLMPRFGATKALDSWSGQELTHKDFSYDNSWAEVKTINRSAQSVKISSIEQLTSHTMGELIVYSLEKMSMTYHGITLNDLIIKVHESLINVDDKDNFLSKVALQGYEYNSYYDNFVFEIADKKVYLVSDKFPKITRELMPKAIIKASYELSLQEIDSFKV